MLTRGWKVAMVNKLPNRSDLKNQYLFKFTNTENTDSLFKRFNLSWKELITYGFYIILCVAACFPCIFVCVIEVLKYCCPNSGSSHNQRSGIYRVSGGGGGSGNYGGDYGGYYGGGGGGGGDGGGGDGGGGGDCGGD